MKKLVVSFVGAAALATIGMAAAGGSTAAFDNNSGLNNNAAGIFVSGGLGYGNVFAKKSDYNPQPTSLKTGGLAWNTNVGYQFNQYLAVEAGYTSFGEAKATLGSMSLTTSLGGFGADVKGIYPINSQFDVFAKAGAIDMHETLEGRDSGVTIGKVTGNAWTPMLGLGTSYNINNHVALNLQDVYAFRTNFKKNGATHSMFAANAVLLGASYKFNV